MQEDYYDNFFYFNLISYLDLILSYCEGIFLIIQKNQFYSF